MTNHPRVFQAVPTTPFPKDGINDYIVNGRMNTVNPAQEGTKAAAHYQFSLGPGETVTFRLRLSSSAALGRPSVFGKDFDEPMALRLQEAGEFYTLGGRSKLSSGGPLGRRRALGGLLWSKQFSHYAVRRWLNGDPTQPPPAPERKHGRNAEWTHLYNE